MDDLAGVLVLLGLLACIAGAVLGWAGQLILFKLLAGLLPAGVPGAYRILANLIR